MNLEDVLNQEPVYDHLNLKTRHVTLELTQEEQAVILTAYDRGIDCLNENKQQQLNIIIAKLKDTIHP